MQRRTVIFLLLACTVCAVGAMIAFSGPGGTVAPPDGGSDKSATSGQNPADGPGKEGAAGTQPAVPLPPGAPRVVVTVTATERFVPPPPELPLVETVTGVPLWCDAVAGIGSGFDVGLHKRGISLLAFGFDGRTLLRQVAVSPQSQQVAKIAARVVVRGQVLDLEQKPVAEASVWFGELAADGTRFEVTTNADGQFDADVPAGQGVPMLVRAADFATTWRTVSVEPGMLPLRQGLQPATSLTVLLAARAVDIERARAFVVPTGAMSTGMAQWPFFAQAVAGGYAFDKDGRVVIDDLPQDGSLGIVVVHPYAALAAPKKVTLDRQAVQVIVPVSFVARRQSGLVVDDDGRAVSASLWAAPSPVRLNGPRSLRLLPPHLDVRGACFAATDSTGRFVLGLPTDKVAHVAVRAKGYAGRNLEWRDGLDQAVVLPRWIGGEPSLRILPPAAGAEWQLAINLGDGIVSHCAAGEPFVVSLPHAGRFDVAVAVTYEGEPETRRDVLGLVATGVVDLVTAAPK